MTADWHERALDWDPSLGIALAALIRSGAVLGGARMGDLAVAYRHDHLDLHGGVEGELTQQSGALSVDDARRHLRSVLPRLVLEGVVEPVTDQPDDDTVVRLTDPVRAELAQDPEARRQTFLELARDKLHRAESGHGRPAQPPSGSVLEAVGLRKVYRRRPVVDDVDVDVRQGEIVGLLGPNGAGKTTTFYMIVGLVRPDGGDIRFDGTSIARLPMYKRARRGIGYLAQEPSVFRKLTVEQNVMAILETLKISAAERRERLETLLDELSIKHLRKTPAFQLSGGERRRLEITRALVTEPKFMLLDEPFAGVDPIAVHDIQTIVASLRDRGIGVLITDHNVEQTFDIVDRAYIMFEGKVKVAGSVQELVFDDRVADIYLGPTLTAKLRQRLLEPV